MGALREALPSESDHEHLAFLAHLMLSGDPAISYELEGGEDSSVVRSGDPSVSFELEGGRTNPQFCPVTQWPITSH